MMVAKMTYEELRRQRLEENKRRMEELHLPQLSHSFKKVTSQKSSMMKAKPRIFRTELVAVRRSDRVAKKPAPDYKDVTFYDRVELPMRRICKKRELLNGVYASDKARAFATEQAEKLESNLQEDYPTFVKPMLKSHVSGGFWLGLPAYFSKTYLPKNDDTITLVDELNEEHKTIYLARKTGLSGGWKGFSVDHELVDGDALVFQLIQPTVFKVYIIRVNSIEAGNVLQTTDD